MNLFFDERFNRNLLMDEKSLVYAELNKLFAAIEGGTFEDFLKVKGGRRVRGSEALFGIPGPEPGTSILFKNSDEVIIIDYLGQEIPGIYEYDEDNSIVVKIKPEGLEEVLLGDLKKYPVRLSTKQEELLGLELPLIISGSAGSGKSLVTLHAISRAESDERKPRCVYLTLIPGLREKAESDYRRIKGKGEDDELDIEFYDIKEFCLKETARTEERFVNFFIFERDFFADLSGVNFSPMDVWTEIRGVIKGKLNIDWHALPYFNQADYHFSTVNFLREKDAILSDMDDERRLSIKPDFVENDERWDWLIGEARKGIYAEIKEIEEDIRRLKKIYYYGYSGKKKNLSEREYLSLDEEASPYSDEERKAIYGIYEEYDAWLGANGYFDDNDLAREIADKVLAGEADKVDMLAVDEVQDFTEQQIFMLFAFAEKSGNKIVFSGDEHQIINPTVFSMERLTTLFYKRKTKVNFFFLSKNYRSQKKIINLTNELAHERQKLIGAKKIETEIEEEAIREGVSPSLTEPSEENLLAVKEAVLDTPSSAIIVSDEEKKNEFMANFPEIADRVFTVFDAKGLEFYNVFVCNLLTAHKKEWAEIYRRNVRRNTKYRFYFNAFYVATTRATEHLVLLEASFPKNLMRKIGTYVEASERFEEEAVLVDSNTNRASDWLREGQRLETHGDFTRAIAAYKRSGAKPENAWRVEAKLGEERREWVEATKGYIKAGDFDGALRVAKLSGEGEWERFARMLSDLSTGRETDIVDIDFYRHAKDNFGDDAGAAILIVSKLLTGSIIGKE